MTKSPKTTQELIDRYSNDWKGVIYPFLVLHVIKEYKKASSLEIKKHVKDKLGKDMEYNYTSYYRLIARLEDELGLIEPVDVKKDKGPARVYYSLTQKGQEVYERVLNQIVTPFNKLFIQG